MTVKTWRAIAITSILALVLLLLTSYFHIWVRRPASPATIITEVHKLNQLVTVRYSIQRVVGIKEPKVPVGEESILLMVQGEVLAGVDLDRVRARDLQYAGNRSIVVALPPAQILNNFLDEDQTKVWDRHITWWTPWVPYDPELEHKARLQAIHEVRDAALKMGILDQAEKNAKVSISELLSPFGLQVSFKTRPLD
jgi:hypothetical protein